MADRAVMTATPPNTTLGASTPLKELQRRFGFTKEQIVLAVNEIAGKAR
jgi:hypothetical protein